MTRERPHLVVIAGPNGAGKSTLAPKILQNHLRIATFVNADTIARGLTAFAPDSAALAAGRIMLRRLHELAEEREDFAFETTLATRGFARWFPKLRASGYQIHLYFLGLPNAETAVARVRARVAAGGHSVPEETIRRRYVRGLRNLFRLYLPLLDSWAYYENVSPGPKPIAGGYPQSTAASRLFVFDEMTWQKLDEFR